LAWHCLKSSSETTPPFAQRSSSLDLVRGKSGVDLGLFHPCPGFIQGDGHGLAMRVQTSLFGLDLQVECRDLGTQPGQMGAGFVPGQPLGLGVELDQHLARAHAAAELEMRAHHPSGHRGRQGMGRDFCLQPRAVCHLVDRDPIEQKPGAPSPQQYHGDDKLEGPMTRTVGLNGA
jgi:hypothetical protein